MALKVLMIGGRRCGKTSALASMFDQMINGPVKHYFTTSDTTLPETKGEGSLQETKDSLPNKTAELENLLEEPSSSIFVVDQNPTFYDWDYNLKLQLPGSHRSMEMQFIDVPGEWFDAGKTEDAMGNPYRDKILGHIASSDVFVIVVDTPMLMYEKESIAKAANCIPNITNYMTNVMGEKAKMVLFVPIKCEKWVKEGRMGEVKDKLLRLYDSLITALKAYPKINIGILPIQTAGNINFNEYSEPMILSRNGQEYRCKKLSSKLLRLGNGANKKVEEGDIINRDPKAVLFGNLMRPYTWFSIEDKPTTEKLYAPQNCDQLTLHILSFYIEKMIEETPNGIIFNIFWKLIFGGITRPELIAKKDEIYGIQEVKIDGIATQQKVIKNNVEGIEYIKAYYPI